MQSAIPEPLFILEMANNHMGNVEHGVRIIREMGEVVRHYPYSFAFKLQYRDLDTFIHPAMQGRQDVKYIKRFSETRLADEDFDRLVDEMRRSGFLTMATPFDEVSVSRIEKQKLDIIKIASCSFSDWPLLERIMETDLPIIASTAGASLDDVDRVISFFLHRSRQFAILHCVGEYPTPADHMNLSQIDFLKSRYPGVRIGFSTHENPSDTDVVKLAIGKGARIFEKHVGVQSSQYHLNAYSANPEEVDAWLAAAHRALTLCGTPDRRLLENPEENQSLRSLRRGVFARKSLTPGDIVRTEDVYFAFPPQDGQFTANDWSKYAEFRVMKSVDADEALDSKPFKRTPTLMLTSNRFVGISPP